MTAAWLSVTLMPWTRPSSPLVRANTVVTSVPLGGSHSTVTANSPASITSRNRRMLPPSAAVHERPSAALPLRFRCSRTTQYAALRFSRRLASGAFLNGLTWSNTQTVSWTIRRVCSRTHPSLVPTVPRVCSHGCRQQRVLHEHRNRHGTHPARYRRDPRRLGRRGFEIHIPHQPTVGQPVDPHVDHHGSVSDHVTFDKVRLPHGRHQNVGPPAHARKIRRLGMTDRHGRVPVHQQQRQIGRASCRE